MHSVPKNPCRRLCRKENQVTKSMKMQTVGICTISTLEGQETVQQELLFRNQVLKYPWEDNKSKIN